MRKPKRSDDKYWKGTRNFNHIQFESDLEDYIIYLESKVEQLHMANVVGQSEQLTCPRCKSTNILSPDKDNDAQCIECAFIWAG